MPAQVRWSHVLSLTRNAPLPDLIVRWLCRKFATALLQPSSRTWAHSTALELGLYCTPAAFAFGMHLAQRSQQLVVFSICVGWRAAKQPQNFSRCIRAVDHCSLRCSHVACPCSMARTRGAPATRASASACRVPRAVWHFGWPVELRQRAGRKVPT